jgi:hypothetical protein
MGWLSSITKPFKSIGKAIGKAFKWVGKTVMKGFAAVGKFANKFGIVGQIGMMWLTGGLMNSAMSGLSTFGQGAMQSLSNVFAVGSKASAAAQAAAKATHMLMTGVKAMVQAPLKTGKSWISNITKMVTSSVRDTVKYLGRALPGKGGAGTIQDFFTRGDSFGLGEYGSRMLDNTVGNIADAGRDTVSAFGDVGKIIKDSGTDFITKGASYNYSPEYATYSPLDSVADPLTGKLPTITKEINYNTIARDNFNEALGKKGIEASGVSFDLNKESLLNRTKTAAIAGTKGSFTSAVGSGGMQAINTAMAGTPEAPNMSFGMNVPTYSKEITADSLRTVGNQELIPKFYDWHQPETFNMNELLNKNSETYQLWSGQNTPSYGYA